MIFVWILLVGILFYLLSKLLNRLNTNTLVFLPNEKDSKSCSKFRWKTLEKRHNRVLYEGLTDSREYIYANSEHYFESMILDMEIEDYDKVLLELNNYHILYDERRHETLQYLKDRVEIDDKLLQQLNSHNPRLSDEALQSLKNRLELTYKLLKRYDAIVNESIDNRRIQAESYLLNSEVNSHRKKYKAMLRTIATQPRVHHPSNEFGEEIFSISKTSSYSLQEAKEYVEIVLEVYVEYLIKRIPDKSCSQLIDEIKSMMEFADPFNIFIEQEETAIRNCSSIYSYYVELKAY